MVHHYYFGDCLRRDEWSSDYFDSSRDPIAAFGPIYEEYNHYKVIDIYKNFPNPF